LELARELGVSPGTVRRALDSLEDDHLLLRRQGRGTFVADHDSGELALRFSNLRDGTGRRIGGSFALISQSCGPASATERDRLQLEDCAPVLRTVGSRRDELGPFMFEEACLATGRFPGLDGAEIGNYRIASLAQRFGVHLGRGWERLTVVAAAGDSVAKQLEIEASTPLLKLDRVVLTIDGLPVEWRVGLCHLRGDTAYVGEMS
jgi:GntR family transcriptional regulator